MVSKYLFISILFSPIINSSLENITKYQRLYLLAILTFMSVYIGNVTEGDISLVEGKNLTNFLLLYTLGNTIRHYQHVINGCAIMKLIIGYVFSMLFGFGFMYIPLIAGKIWKYSYAYNSPIIMLNSIWVFAIFSKLKVRPKFINWLGSGVFACYLLQCPSIIWKNCFERPIQYIYGVANEPWQIIPIMVLYAVVAMLLMTCLDKLLNPLWNRLVAFAAKYDEKWNTKQLR